MSEYSGEDKRERLVKLEEAALNVPKRDVEGDGFVMLGHTNPTDEQASRKAIYALLNEVK